MPSNWSFVEELKKQIAKEREEAEKRRKEAEKLSQEGKGRGG